MTATQVKHRRGTASQVAAMTPAEAEIVVNLTDDRLHLGDGLLAGGIVLPNVYDLMQQKFVYAANSTVSANSILLTLPVAPVSIAAPLCIQFKANATTTGNIQINLNGTGLVDAYKLSGSALVQAGANDVITDMFYEATFDGARWVLTSGSGGSSIATVTSGNYVIGSSLYEVVSAVAATGTFDVPIGISSFFSIPYTGTVKASHSISGSNSGSFPNQGRWYKNGVAVGTGSSNGGSSSAYGAASENLTVNAGDVLNLKAYNPIAVGGGVNIKNIKISVSEYLPAISAY